VVSRPIREETARLMCALLARVTEEGGTGRRAAVPGYRVAGKTGTAVKPGVGGYDSNRNIASFIGLIPAEDPVLAIAVSVDEPQPERTGGVVAAPVFRRIAEEAVRYLNIPSREVEANPPSWAGTTDEPMDEQEARYVDWAAM
jgi:cell division protein FtsI (penicillin-binding protein 3)